MKSRKGRKRRKKKRSFSRQRIRSFLLHREKALFAIKRKASRRRKELLMKNRKRKKAEKAKTEQHAFAVEK